MQDQLSSPDPANAEAALPAETPSPTDSMTELVWPQSSQMIQMFEIKSLEHRPQMSMVHAERI